jgi:hypothetical protein
VLSVILALVLMTTASAVSAEAIATRLDGSTVVGELASWDGKALTVNTAEGPVLLDAADLLSVRWSPTGSYSNKGDRTPRGPSVELVDGTHLPIEDFSRQRKNATLILSDSLPASLKKVRLPDRLVVAAQLQPLGGEAVKQWEEIRSQNIPGDVLVIVKRGGQSVDYVDGTIGDVTAEKVDFRLDDAQRSVDRSKIAGLIFFRAARTPVADPLCIIHGNDGMRASVASASLHSDVVQISTTAGAEFSWPFEAIQSIDFSAGKVLYLSDVEPANEEQTSLVGLPAGATLAAMYSQPRRDRSAFGGPLSLWFPGTDSLAPLGHAQAFGRGLAVRSRTELEYRVPRGFTRLLGVAGIEPATRANGSARLMISGDERSLINEELVGDKPPVDIELDISGVKRLKIVVDYGKNLDTGDWVNLCDLRMVK